MKLKIKSTNSKVGSTKKIIYFLREILRQNLNNNNKTENNLKIIIKKVLIQFKINKKKKMLLNNSLLATGLIKILKNEIYLL